MTLDEARKHFEDQSIVGPMGNYHQAPTGQPYIELVSGGVKEEGERLPCLCSSEAKAIELWFRAAMIYAATRAGTLYWRKLPEINEGYVLEVDAKGNSDLDAELRGILTRKVYFVYSRLLISDLPVIQSATKAA